MDKIYVGFIRDHSGSMRLLRNSAADDYNSSIAQIKEEAVKNNIDTIVTVIECGSYNPITSTLVKPVIINSSVNALNSITYTEYNTIGSSTPLFDSIGKCIEIFESLPDKNENNVSFLIFITTDGYENSSINWKYELPKKIKLLQGSDKWTFVFRVPIGTKNGLKSLGIPEGNILEWNTTSEGMKESTSATVSGISNYYGIRSSGKLNTKSFYTNLENVSISQIQSNLIDITNHINRYYITDEHNNIEIKKFVELNHRIYEKGNYYYELTKPETVQEYKRFIIEHKETNKLYTGIYARQLLNLPSTGSIRLIPGNDNKYWIYVQSTSNNRKLKSRTYILYYKGYV